MRAITNNNRETQRLGRFLAEEIRRGKPKNKRALVIALFGELGSGKTTFVRGFARGLGIKRRILSPSFLVVKKYRLSGSVFLYLYHMDYYRLSGARDTKGLGLKDVFGDPKNIIIVEWAERVTRMLPARLIRVRFSHISPSKREIVFLGL